MDADFSVEWGPEDPVLDFPWKDPEGKLAYFDLKRHPEWIAQVEDAKKFPKLGEFLRIVNSARSVAESAKCDVWTTTELSVSGIFPKVFKNIGLESGSFARLTPARASNCQRAK